MAPHVRRAGRLQAMPDEDELPSAESLRRAAEEHPHDAAKLLLYAMRLSMDRGEDGRAEAAYERAIAADPSGTEALMGYAKHRMLIRWDHEGAEALYRRAMGLDPENVEVLEALAGLLSIREGGGEEADALHRRAVEIDPTDPLTAQRYAMFLTIHRRDPVTGEREIRRAMSLDPTNPDYLIMWSWWVRPLRPQGPDTRMLFPDSLERFAAATLELTDWLRRPEHPGLSHGFIAECVVEHALHLLDLGRGEVAKDAALRLRAWRGAPVERHAEINRWLLVLLVVPEAEIARSLRGLVGLRWAEGDPDPAEVWPERIARAMREGHPHARWLAPMIEVLKGKAEESSLADWPEWQAARTWGEERAKGMGVEEKPTGED